MCERETIQDQGKSLAPRHQGGRKGGPNFVEQLKQVLFELTHYQGVWLLFLRCFGTSAPGATHMMVSLLLCTSDVSLKSPSRV